MKNFLIVNKSELSDLITEAVGNAISNFKPEIPQAKEKKYLTRQEVCEKLNISLPTLWKLTKNNEIQGCKIGGRVLYDLELVEQAVRIRNFKPKI
jgi:excisionase family DNA binding protein